MATNTEIVYCSHCGNNGNLVEKDTKYYHETCYRILTMADDIASTELTIRLAEQPKNTVPIKSKDFFLPPLSQFGNSIQDIILHFSHEAPHRLSQPLQDIRQKIKSYVQRTLLASSDKRVPEKDANQDCFVFLDKSLGIHLADELYVESGSHVCDVFILIQNHPSMVLTIVEEDSTCLQQYNLSLAKELRMSMNRFIDDNYNPVFGTISKDKLINVDDLCQKIKSLVKCSSRFVTRDSVSMTKKKYSKVLKSFWMCIAKVQSGALGHDKNTTIHFLTKEQCVSIVEYINTRQVHIKTKSKSGATLMMLELAKRLQRTGKTCLRFQLKTDVEKYRDFPGVVTTEDDKLPKHFITDSYISEVTLSSVPGNVWIFTSEFIPKRLLAKEIEEIMEQQFLLLVGSPGEGKTVLMQMILEHFKDIGVSVLSLEDIDKLKEDEETIVYADDVFGKHSDTFHLTLKFEQFLEKLMTNNQIKFVCTSRDDLYKLALPQLGRYKRRFQGQFKTNLSEVIEEEEKRMMLQKYIREEEIHLSDAIIAEVVESTKSKGFALSCHMFVTTHKPDMNPVQFFENPGQHIMALIRNHLEHYPRKVLLYILVSSEGQFDVVKLSDQESAERQQFEEVKRLLDVKEKCSLTDLNAAVGAVKVGLLKSTANGLTFHHPSIYEMVASVIAEKDIDFIVRYAPLVFFTHDYNLFLISLPRKRFNAVSKRLSDKLSTGDISSYKSILLQDDQFADEVCSHLSTILATDPQRRSEMMYWAASSKSCLLRKLINKYLDDNISVQKAIKGCCRWNDKSSLDFILKKESTRSIDVNLIEENGLPCLTIAANKNHEAVVEILLQFGADVNITENRTGGTALHWASSAGHLSVVSKLLQKGILIDQENVGGATALFLAASNGHSDVVKILLQSGANKNKQIRSRMISLEKRPTERSAEIRNMHYSDKGFTPLHVSSFEGHIETVNVLLEHDADPSIESNQGSAVVLAAKANQKEVFEVLINTGKIDLESALNAAYEFGRTSLLDVLLLQKPFSEYTLIRHAFKGNVSEITKLLQNNAESLKMTMEGFTALHFASVAGKSDVVQQLLKEDFEVNVSSGQKLTALHGAAVSGHLSIALDLIGKNADVNVLSKEYSSLHYASMHGHADVVHALLEHDAEINIQGARQWTPLHLACNENHLDVVKVLLKYGAEKEVLTDNLGTPLLFAAYEGNLEIVDFLIQNQAVLNPNGEVFSPLLGAAIASNKKSIKHLLKKGALVNHLSAMGVAAVHGATLMGSLDVVKELIHAEADVNIRLFDKVKEESKRAVFNHILTWGKTTPGREINVETYDQGSPLHIAADLGYVDIAEALVKAGAKSDLKNIRGQMPIEVAQKKGHKAIIGILR